MRARKGLGRRILGHKDNTFPGFDPGICTWWQLLHKASCSKHGPKGKAKIASPGCMEALEVGYSTCPVDRHKGGGAIGFVDCVLEEGYDKGGRERSTGFQGCEVSTHYSRPGSVVLAPDAAPPLEQVNPPHRKGPAGC